MASEIRAFQVTVPITATPALPSIFDVSFPPRVVTQLQITVPPGPNGLAGFRFTSGGLPVIPINPGAWLVASDERINWDLSNQLTTGAWQIMAYNLGGYPHTLYFRFLLDLIPVATPAPGSGLLPLSLITPGVDGLTAGAGLEALS